MNYEQKYKEALERAEKLYEQGTITESLNYIFPELKEDDKIKRELKRAIADALDYSFFDKETADNCLVWLEKQGEQKSAWSVEDYSKVQRICQYLNEAKKYYADITEVRECIEWLKSLKDRVQLQSQPTEWDEEDERIRQGLIENFKWFCGDFPETTKWGKDDDMLVKDIITWLEKQGKSEFDEIKIWKPADGDDLPEYGREVIVLRQPSSLDSLERTDSLVAFSFRPDPKGWEGISISTGKGEHFTPKTYGKGGWSIPDVVWWLDLELPK